MERTHQNQVGQLGRPTVFPMPDVVGVQTAGGPAPGNHAAPVPVLQSAAQPPVDRPGHPPGPDRLTAAFEPHLTGRIAGQILPIGLAQQRTQMQRGRRFVDIKVHHHRRVLAVRTPRDLGIPTGLHQPPKRLHRARKRPAPTGLAPGVASLGVVFPAFAPSAAGGIPVAFPLGDQPVPVRGQRRLELRRLNVRECDPLVGELLVAAFGDRTRRLGLRARIRTGPWLGVGPRLKADRGA